jgi:hypothetical protein
VNKAENYSQCSSNMPTNCKWQKSNDKRTKFWKQRNKAWILIIRYLWMVTLVQSFGNFIPSYNHTEITQSCLHVVIYKLIKHGWWQFGKGGDSIWYKPPYVIIRCSTPLLRREPIIILSNREVRTNEGCHLTHHHIINLIAHAIN